MCWVGCLSLIVLHSQIGHSCHHYPGEHFFVNTLAFGRIGSVLIECNFSNLYVVICTVPSLSEGVHRLEVGTVVFAFSDLLLGRPGAFFVDLFFLACVSLFL